MGRVRKGGKSLLGDFTKLLLLVTTALGGKLPKCCRLGEVSTSNNHFHSFSQVLERGGCVLQGEEERPMKVFAITLGNVKQMLTHIQGDLLGEMVTRILNRNVSDNIKRLIFLFVFLNFFSKINKPYAYIYAGLQSNAVKKLSDICFCFGYQIGEQILLMTLFDYFKTFDRSTLFSKIQSSICWFPG